MYKIHLKHFTVGYKKDKLVPDRCVQSVVSLKNRSVRLSCGFPLGAGFLLQCSAVYQMFKTSSPLYKGSLVLNILYTAVRIRHRAGNHMTDENIYFSG